MLLAQAGEDLPRGREVEDIPLPSLHPGGIVIQARLLSRLQARRLEPQELGNLLLQTHTILIGFLHLAAFSLYRAYTHIGTFLYRSEDDN